MQDKNMPRGCNYEFEYLRVVGRAEGLKALEKSRKLQAERDKLVAEGKARWVKVPILNGYKLVFEKL